MIEIKEGPELDRAVAVAIGFRRLIALRPTVIGPVGLYADAAKGEIVEVGADDPRMPEAVIPKYSTDLNAAFEAADQVRLFDPDGSEAFLSQHPAGEVEWKLWWADSASSDGGHAVYKSTPALAICAAILKERT